jgi:hypothetical protein
MGKVKSVLLFQQSAKPCESSVSAISPQMAQMNADEIRNDPSETKHSAALLWENGSFINLKSSIINSYVYPVSKV